MNAIIYISESSHKEVQDLEKISVCSLNGQLYKEITDLKEFSLIKDTSYTFQGKNIFCVPSNNIVAVNFK